MRIFIFVLIVFIKSAFAGVCEGSFRSYLKSYGNGLIRSEDLPSPKSTAQINFERDLQAIRASKQEPLLAKQGFSPAYYRGVDQVREFNRAVQFLREINAQPQFTHIPYFAEQAEKMLNTFTTDFKQQNKDKLKFLEDRLNRLKSFKKELQERVKNQAVTYDWWANFNTRLALLADPSFSVLSGTDEDIKMMMMSADLASVLKLGKNGLLRAVETFNEIKTKIFPKEIMFFSMDALGIMAFNALEGQSYLVGVTTKTWEADNLTMRPFRFFQHDLEHINFYKPINALLSTEEIRLKDEAIQRRLDGISNKSDREKAELALFIFKRESVSDPVVRQILRGRSVQEASSHEPKQLSREEQRELLRETVEAHISYLLRRQKDFQELLPEGIKTQEEILLFSQELSHIFNDLFVDIFVP